jgi:uncharacterized OB-fold protein
MSEAELPPASTSMTIPADWHIHYNYTTGPIVAHFLQGLAQERIEGIRCPGCGIVYLPPRAYCERDFIRTTEWVPVGPEGTLEAFTIVSQKFENLPDPPYVIAFARLDGADTAMVNFLHMPIEHVEQAAAQLHPGTRIRVRFHATRKGRITDFHYELA